MSEPAGTVDGVLFNVSFAGKGARGRPGPMAGGPSGELSQAGADPARGLGWTSGTRTPCGNRAGGRGAPAPCREHSENQHLMQTGY